MNDTATTYTIDQGFAALEAIKSAKAKYDAIASREAVGGFRHCPDAAVAAAYHEAGQKLFEVADYFFAALTGFKTLNECLEDQGHGYRPTFREAGGKDLETVFLAEVYDYLAETRGLPLRAYRPERAAATAALAKSHTVHLLDDLGVYKATLKRNFADNDRGAEFDRDRELLARRTQRYTLEEAEVLLGWCSTAHDDCVDENPEDYSPIEVYTARQKLLRRDEAVARLEALKAAAT